MEAVIAGDAWDEHARAVERLRASYAAIPPGQPVRLAKKTSNLFRPRQATHAPGLDVSGLDGVIYVDPQARTADVAGMTTYEHLVDATLPYGLMPFVVPQLRTITLGGAVSGLGIESTSFRSGLPHESVIEMDVFTGAGEVVTTRPGDELFDAFPNSYGSLGYATRLRIELEPIRSHVALRHVRFDDAGLLAKTIAMITEAGEYAGERVDGVDGVAFEPGEYYLTLARWSDHPGSGATASDYTGQQIYYKSIQQRETDLLTTYDYLWRWDTDWFWCSGAFGAQNPRLRRIWPSKYRRSDVFYKMVGWDHRFHIADKPRQARRSPPARAGHPGRRDPGRQAARVPRVVRRRGRHAAGLAVPLAGLDTARSSQGSTAESGGGRPTRSSSARRTSTSASGAPSTSAPSATTHRGTAPSRPRCTSSAATRGCTPRRSTTARPSTACTTGSTSRPSSRSTTPTTG